MMTVIRKARPSTDLMRVTRAFDRLFDDAAYRPLAWGGPVEARLPLDVTSSEDAVVIEAALPGVNPEDVEITVHQDNLTIAVKEQAEEERTEGDRVYRELRRSSGTRTLTLPSGMDTEHARADFDNGMLKLYIPRAEAAKPRQIQVNTATPAAKQVAAEARGTDDGTDADAGQQA
jgi:HSP20 family protein